MAGRVTFIKPMGNNPHGDNNPDHYPQNLGMRIMGAGNVQASGYGFTPALTQSLAVAPPNYPQFPFSKQRVFQAVSPTDSGNVGTMKPLPGDCNRMHGGQYIAMGDMAKLAGQPNTLLNSPQKLNTGNARVPNAWKGDTIQQPLSWDAVTGFATYGANRGQPFQAVNPIGGASGVLEPMPTDAVPGHLVYMVDGQVPASSVYGPRHDS